MFLYWRYPCHLAYGDLSAINNGFAVMPIGSKIYCMPLVVTKLLGTDLMHTLLALAVLAPR